MDGVREELREKIKAAYNDMFDYLKQVAENSMFLRVYFLTVKLLFVSRPLQPIFWYCRTMPIQIHSIRSRWIRLCLIIHLSLLLLKEEVTRHHQ